MTLTSFGADLNVAVFGASGGIGRAFVAALDADPAVARVHAVARRAPSDLPDKAVPHDCDPLDDAALAALMPALTETGPLTLAIVATGILHDGDKVAPEKSWRQIDADAMCRVLEVNTVAPSLIAKHVLPLLDRERKSCLAALSARVGIIDDNRLGGWVSYRASKAALNMVIRTLAIELSRRNPMALFVGLHPGTVDTGLSEPFQGNVPQGKLFSPARSVSLMLGVLDGLRSSDSGYVFAYDGDRL